MSSSDRAYLLETQYRDAANLNARVALHERFSANRASEHRWLFDQFDLPPHAEILELGCGPATLWQKNLDRLPPGWTIILTDFSPGMLAEAERTLAAGGHPFRFLRVDVQQIPFPAEQFDAVIANYMLYHVPDLNQALAEIHRVLRPGGRLYAATNGRAHMCEVKEMINHLGAAASPVARTDERPRFRLDDGGDLLAPFFSKIEPRRRENALVVTEIEPLIAYILSTSWAHDVLSTLGPNEAARSISALRDEVAEQLARDGAIRITEESGLFLAWRE